METFTLETDGARIVYDVRGPLPRTDGQPVLLLIGQPMDASGFGTLAANLSDRTVVTYDPRGLGRSTRSDGQVSNDPQQQAEDLHALIGRLGAGPVDLFGSSGGAITAFALVSRHPEDVRTLVAHEPPLLTALPDSGPALAAWGAVRASYDRAGWGAGMATFIAFTSHQGEFTEAYATQPEPDPAQFGLPAHDDGSRTDPLLSGASDPVNDYRIDATALQAAPTRIVLAAGEETGNALTRRATEAVGAQLGLPVVDFPGGHGGFLGDEYGQPGKPDAFAERLRGVLATS